MARWLQLGIEAFQNGKRDQARRFFRHALMETPEDVTAWLWLSEAVETDTEKMHCLEQALKFDPGNAMALTAIDIVKTRASRSNLPHVAPFHVEEGSAQEESAPASAGESPTPAAPASTGKTNPAAARTKPVSPQPFWRRRETWLVAGLCLAGLAATAVLVLLILQGIPK